MHQGLWEAPSPNHHPRPMSASPSHALEHRPHGEGMCSSPLSEAIPGQPVNPGLFGFTELTINKTTTPTLTTDSGPSPPAPTLRQWPQELYYPHAARKRRRCRQQRTDLVDLTPNALALNNSPSTPQRKELPHRSPTADTARLPGPPSDSWRQPPLPPPESVLHTPLILTWPCITLRWLIVFSSPWRDLRRKRLCHIQLKSGTRVKQHHVSSWLPVNGRELGLGASARSTER